MKHLDELISGYLDGELTADEELRAVTHLEECQACREELADIHAARAAVRSLPVIDLSPPGAWAPPLRPWWRRPTTMAAAAAAAVLVVGLRDLGAPPRPAIDLEAVADRHVARALLDPGLVATKVAAAVDE